MSIIFHLQLLGQFILKTARNHGSNENTFIFTYKGMPASILFGFFLFTKAS